MATIDNRQNHSTISQILADSRNSSAASLTRLRAFSLDVSRGHSLATYSLSRLTLSQVKKLLEDPKARIEHKPNWWSSSIVLTGWTPVFLPTKESRPSLADQWRSFLKNWAERRAELKKKRAKAEKQQRSRYRKNREASQKSQ